jgi:hypothetical protein
MGRYATRDDLSLDTDNIRLIAKVLNTLIKNKNGDDFKVDELVGVDSVFSKYMELIKEIHKTADSIVEKHPMFDFIRFDNYFYHDGGFRSEEESDENRETIVEYIKSIENQRNENDTNHQKDR